MTDALFYKGRPLTATLMVPEFTEVRSSERKWAHRVMWRRDQRYKVHRSRLFLDMNGVLFAHPNTVELVRQTVPAPSSTNSTAQHDDGARNAMPS